MVLRKVAGWTGGHCHIIHLDADPLHLLIEKDSNYKTLESGRSWELTDPPVTAPSLALPWGQYRGMSLPAEGGGRWGLLHSRGGGLSSGQLSWGPK